MSKNIEKEPTGLTSAMTTRSSTELIPFVRADMRGDLSTSVSCRIDKLKRFKSDLDIYSEILLDGGNDIEIIEISNTRLSKIFENASPKRQYELSSEIIQTIEAKLRGRFSSDLSLLHDLLREDEQGTIEIVAKDQRTWRELFEQSSRKDRLQVTRGVREKTENILIQRFDGYLQSWSQTLSDSHTISPKEATQQIDKLKQTYDGASKRGKVGLSKQLKKKLMQIQQVNFLHF